MAEQMTFIAPKTRQDYAEEISRTWQRAVASIIETGLLIVEAKGNLAHGEFIAMIETDLPFRPRTAQRLMGIAKHPVISNATHVSLLPPSWGTLYELTQLPDETLEIRIADGTINPGMERKDALALKRQFLPRPKSKAATGDDARSMVGVAAACAHDVKRRVIQALHEIPAPERAELLLVLRHALDELEQQFEGCE
jgi:hypothetical protein